MINSREKINGFYLGKKTDNNAVAFWKHHPVADQCSEEFLDSTISFQQKFDCDLVKLTPAGTWQVIDYGLKDKWDFDHLGRRTVKERLVNNPDDWNKIKLFTELTHFIKKILSTANETRKNISSEIPVIQTIFSPISQAILLSGIETFKQHLKEYPNLVMSCLKILSDNTIKTISEISKIGLDGIYYSAQHMSEDFFSAEEYKSFALDFDLKCIKACKTFPFNIIHVHGNNVYFHLEELDKNWAIHYEFSNTNPKPESVSSTFKNPILLGIPSELIIACNDSKEINDIIDKFSAALNRDNVFITAGCVLPLNTSDENTSLWIKTIKNRKFK